VWQVLLVNRLDAAEMLLQGTNHGLRQHRHAVLAPLALANGDFPALEVQILHPQNLDDAVVKTGPRLVRKQAQGQAALVSENTHDRCPIENSKRPPH